MFERPSIVAGASGNPAVLSSDRSALQSVEKVRKYQTAIRNSRLAVLRSDAYHIAAANPEECIADVLAFDRENA